MLQIHICHNHYYTHLKNKAVQNHSVKQFVIPYYLHYYIKVTKLSSKFQLSVPKAIAEKAGIRPGDELECEAAGDVIRIRQRNDYAQAPRTVTDRLILFDLATERQSHRDHDRTPDKAIDRGWSRENLYERKG